MYTHIEDPVAYERAVKARIYANARKGRLQRLQGEAPTRNETEVALRRMAQVQGIPEIFSGFYSEDRRLQFPTSLLMQYVEYGKLSEKQLAWVERLSDPEAMAAHEAEVAAKNAERAARAAASQHIGTVGQKVDFTATVEMAKPVSTRFGGTTLIKMRDASGNCLVWWASAYEATYVSPGDVLSGHGKVKSHDEYQGEKQTTLTRCSVTWPR